MAVLRDPAGAPFCVWEPGERQGAQRVNEPGAWAMSMLSTDDPDGPRSSTAPSSAGTSDVVDAGASTFTLCAPARLRRRRATAAGSARRRRGDGAGRSGTRRPRWSVDFWVSSADEAAARASDRGGSVIVAPREVPGFRNAVLADPQGAVFSVSQLLAPDRCTALHAPGGSDCGGPRTRRLGALRVRRTGRTRSVGSARDARFDPDPRARRRGQRRPARRVSPRCRARDRTARDRRPRDHRATAGRGCRSPERSTARRAWSPLDLRGRGAQQRASAPLRDGRPHGRPARRARPSRRRPGRAGRAIRSAATSWPTSPPQHPARVHAAVLVDGGLTIPGSEGVDPQEFADEFLGPALARLKLTFASREAYHEWWREHPAFATAEVADADLAAYADHDLIGSAPELHSSVPRTRCGRMPPSWPRSGARRTGSRSTRHLLCAPRGLLERPQPDAADRAGRGMGRRGPAPALGDARPRRQPLHDHARPPRRERCRPSDRRRAPASRRRSAGGTRTNCRWKPDAMCSRIAAETQPVKERR